MEYRQFKLYEDIHYNYRLLAALKELKITHLINNFLNYSLIIINN